MGYSYGYGSGLGSLGSVIQGGTAFAILTLVALIAAIVVAVILYKKYVAAPPSANSVQNKANWGPFLRFDRMIIYNVLCALYIFCASFALFEAVAIALAAIAGGVGAFLVALILAAIGCVVTELLLRVSFETSMLLVNVTRNTTAIKNQVCGTDDQDPFVKAPAPVPPAPQPPFGAYPQQPYQAQPQQPYQPYQAPQQPAPAQPQQPYQAAPADSPYAQPTPTADNPYAQPAAPVAEPAPAQPQPAVCPVCGAPIHDGDTFCRQCGAKL